MNATERAVTDGMTPEEVNDVIRPLVGTGKVTP